MEVNVPMDITQPTNIVNLVGGAIILFFLVWQVVEKACGNISWVKARREKREKEKAETRKKEITTLVNNVIVPPILKEIETINDEQNQKLDRLVKSSNDTIRLELLRTYFKYRPYKKILQWAKEAANHLHTDYIAQDGNSFIEDLWNQMASWEVVPSDDELHTNLYTDDE